MTMDKFRILHSTAIEHYQFIEHHLEGIFATISGEPFHIGLKYVEKTNIKPLIEKIKTLEKRKQISILSDSDYKRLQQVCSRRNYWCHECYVDMIFDIKTGLPKPVYIDSLIEDIKEAELLRDTLYQKKAELMNRRFL